MPKETEHWPYSLPAMGILIGVWLFYTALTLLAPVGNDAKFHVSFLSLTLLRLTIIVPAIIIWTIAMRGATAFKNYAAMIAGSKEAPAVNLMANGLLWIVAYLLSAAVLSALTPFITEPRAIDPFIIVRDHVPPLCGLIGFLCLYYGSNALKSVAKFSTWTWATILTMVLFAAFAIMFVLNFSHTSTAPIAGQTLTSTSIVPLKVLLFTLILPYLISWFVGLLAAMNIYRYSKNVSGILYRRALKSLVWGIVTVILFASAVQATSFADRFLTNLSLGALLIIVYVFIVFYSLGFVFIWMGAKQLKRLEALE